MTAPTVAEIDFLPADFHRRRSDRRARRFRWTLGAMFLVLIAVGFVGNQIQHRQLTAHRERLMPRAEAVKKLDQQLNDLRTRIGDAKRQADLRGYLRLQPAATRLLAAITTSLPPDVALKSIKLNVATPSQQAVHSQNPDSQKAEATTPHAADLRRLADEFRQRRREITIDGIAPDDEAIHEYLLALRTAGAFDEVQLLYTNRHEHLGHEVRLFAAQLRVRRITPSRLDGPPGTSIVSSIAGVSQ